MPTLNRTITEHATAATPHPRTTGRRTALHRRTRTVHLQDDQGGVTRALICRVIGHRRTRVIDDVEVLSFGEFRIVSEHAECERCLRWLP